MALKLKVSETDLCSVIAKFRCHLLTTFVFFSSKIFHDILVLPSTVCLIRILSFNFTDFSKNTHELEPWGRIEKKWLSSTVNMIEIVTRKIRSRSANDEIILLHHSFRNEVVIRMSQISMLSSYGHSDSRNISVCVFGTHRFVTGPQKFSS